MKKNFTALLFFLISVNLYAQYNKQKTYRDAGQLKKIVTVKGNILNWDDQRDDFFKVLESYGLNADSVDNNPFFYGKVPELTNPKGGNPGNPEFYSSQRPDFVSSVSSSSWQGAAINGIANFMAGRFKQEVLYVGIDVLFEKIINPKTEDDKKEAEVIKAMFPKTCEQIDFLKKGGSYYTADLLYLRQLALDDFENIPENLVTNNAIFFPRLLEEKPIVLDLMIFTNTLINEVKNGRPINDIITVISENKPVSEQDSTIYKITNIVDLISQALLNTTGNETIWINPTDLTNLDDLQVRFFYGLLYEQLKDIPELSTYLDETEINILSQKLRELIMFANKLNTTYNYLKSKEFNLQSPEELITHIKDLNQLFSGFILTTQRIESLRLTFKIDKTVLDLSSRFLNITELFIQKDYQRAIPVLMAELGKFPNFNMKYGRSIAFVSQLATIETSEDMEALLQAYALPIGSASIKRHSNFNLSLNGYVGVTSGWETAYGGQRQTRGNIGLTAPIGVSATFKSNCTLFMSFIDLGSIVNVRLNNDTSAYSNLRFEHFFAPGIGAYYNFKKLPISIGAHFSYIPNLRTIKYSEGAATITESNTDVTRINFSLLFDIPFYTLYNRPSK